MTLNELTESMLQGSATQASAQRGLPPSVFAGSPPRESIRRAMPLGALSLGSNGAVYYAVYGIVATGAGYFAGKAMSPTPSQQRGYGLAGAAASLLLGPVGLGLVGAYALYQR